MNRGETYTDGKICTANEAAFEEYQQYMLCKKRGNDGFTQCEVPLWLSTMPYVRLP